LQVDFFRKHNYICIKDLCSSGNRLVGIEKQGEDSMDLFSQPKNDKREYFLGENVNAWYQFD